jgi:hypothetical protein
LIDSCKFIAGDEFLIASAMAVMSVVRKYSSNENGYINSERMRPTPYDDDLPTCLAPRSSNGLREAEIFHSIKRLSICLLTYFMSILTDFFTKVREKVRPDKSLFGEKVRPNSIDFIDFTNF